MLGIIAGWLLRPADTPAAEPTAAASIRVQLWYGERQRVGHLGISQPDFNVLGHVAGWEDLAHAETD